MIIHYYFTNSFTSVRTAVAALFHNTLTAVSALYYHGNSGHNIKGAKLCSFCISLLPSAQNKPTGAKHTSHSQLHPGTGPFQAEV